MVTYRWHEHKVHHKRALEWAVFDEGRSWKEGKEGKERGGKKCTAVPELVYGCTRARVRVIAAACTLSSGFHLHRHSRAIVSKSTPLR